MGGQETFLARWEPALVESLRARGAVIKEFPPRVDEYLRLLPALPDSTVISGYRMLEPFYFDPTGDRARQAPFLERLARMPGEASAPSGAHAPESLPRR
jgi:hypothetical protein